MNPKKSNWAFAFFCIIFAVVVVWSRSRGVKSQVFGNCRICWSMC